MRGRIAWTLKPVISPVPDSGQDSLQVPSLVGEQVLHPHRRFRVYQAGNESFGLQLLQPFRQHPVTDVWNGIPELREPGAAGEHLAQDGPGPAAPDQLDGPMEVCAEIAVIRHYPRIVTGSLRCNMAGLRTAAGRGCLTGTIILRNVITRSKSAPGGMSARFLFAEQVQWLSNHRTGGRWTRDLAQ